MEIELWKDIPWWENKYKISNLWYVYSYDSQKILYKRTSKEWYRAVSLWREWRGHVYRLWRLMLITWDRPPNHKEQANHKNGIRDDDRLENLEWCTQSENMKHSFQVLWRQASKTYLWKFGAEHNRSKSVIANKNWISYSFDGILDASRITWVCMQNISKCCKWQRNTAWWFTWQFQ